MLCKECGKEHGELTACPCQSVGMIQLYPEQETPYCCPVCHGRQQITTLIDGSIPVDGQGMMGDQYMPCPACDATGIIWR